MPVDMSTLMDNTAGTSAEYGSALWDLLADAGPQHEVIAAGLGLAVRMDKGDWIGKAALGEAPQKLLRSIVFDDPTAVLGKQPVYIDGDFVGYVTSARLFTQPSGAASRSHGCRRKPRSAMPSPTTTAARDTPPR
jgi:hypothetical protein